MKTKRHALILEIITSTDIETQEELASQLQQKGINVTQATVSRDIKELRLIKVLTEKGTYKYAAAERTEKNTDDRYVRFFRETVVSIVGAGNLVVIKTITASAQTAAEAVDNLKWPEVVGTIAGENTVIAIVKNIEDVDDVIERFKALTGKTI